jgi:hypothetical protein
MKKMKKILAVLLAATMIATSCVDDDHSLGELLPKEKINYTVTQDLATDAGGNTVIMTDNTPGTIPIWDYGTGRSNRMQDTIRFAFKGDYVIKFSALTGGGVVECDPITVHVTEDNLMYVNDPLWTLLSGGPGQEKTWVLDLDADGVSKVFTSPVYFAGVAYGWGNKCSDDKDPGCWFWGPVWKDNKWIAAAADYGTMTFSLKGGPFVTVDQKATANAGVTQGTYFLDKDARTITFTDAIPLNQGYDQVYSKGILISLTEDKMQIAFRHPTKSEYEIFNYILKE